jgi:hypothetical protein
MTGHAVIAVVIVCVAVLLSGAMLTRLGSVWCQQV